MILAIKVISSSVFLKALRKTFTKDIPSEKAASNKTPTLLKSMNMGIRVVGTSNQFFIQGS